MAEASILFPVVAPAGETEFRAARVALWPERDGKDRFANAPGIINANELLTQARFTEPTGNRDRGVLVDIDMNGVSGGSFALAMAIADKQARFGPSQDSGKIVATGVLIDRQNGAIGRVEDFPAKLAEVLQLADGAGQSLTFAFPVANAGEITAAAHEQIARLAAVNKLNLLPCRHVDDAKRLWNAPAADELEPPAVDNEAAAEGNGWLVRRWLHLLAGGAALLVSAAVAWFGYFAPIMARAPCEDAADALQGDGADAPRQKRALAVTICRQALVARPNDSRLHFLLGQAYAANANGVLDDNALAEFRMAANGGDMDAAAVLGRALWLSGNPAETAAAHRWLALAAAAGHLAPQRTLALQALLSGDRPAARRALAATFTNTSDDGEYVEARPVNGRSPQSPGPLGLQVSLDQPQTIYSVGATAQLRLTLARPAGLKLWLVTQDGSFQTFGIKSEGGNVWTASVPLPVSGKFQLVVMAKAVAAPAPDDESLARSLSDETAIAGASLLEDRWITLSVGPLG